jgi:CubicO group peptidase (beta-lactamase class C family)
VRLEELVAEGAFPGAAACASLDGRRIVEDVAGRHRFAEDAPVVDAEAEYDLASVTKVFVSVAALVLVAAGEVGLDDRLGDVLDDPGADRAPITLRQLLTHTAGLPSVPQLHEDHPDREGLARALRTVPLDRAPATAVAYTSLGYQYLGWLIEAVAATPLDAFLAEAVLGPCGLERIGFLPGPHRYDAIVPTEWSPVRERLLRGEVHDENSWILGAVTGHTGLFAPAAEVLRFGEALLRDDGLLGGARSLLFEDLTGGLQPARSAAFVRDDPQFGAWPATTWSHTGFTGTSLCLVPEQGVAAVLLSNRVQPTRANERIVDARRRWHEHVRDIAAAHRPTIQEHA